MAKKPTFSRDELTMFIADRAFSLMSKAIWPLSLLAMLTVFSVYAVPYLAGRTTDISFFGQLTATFGADNKGKAELGLTAASLLWAIAERAFRLYKVEKLQSRVKELEARIDPNRTTSGLTPKGLTNPGDK